MAAVLARGAVLYLAAVNAGSAALFAYDKAQAARGGWRVPERRLCNAALYGGWPAGLLAMHLCRHKTRKTAFQKKYVAAAASNALVLVPVLLLMARSPAFRAHFAAAFTRVAGNKPPKRNPPRNRR